MQDEIEQLKAEVQRLRAELALVEKARESYMPETEYNYEPDADDCD